MAVETLAAFRAADKGMNVQPIIVVTKGSDGQIYLAESNPATGGLVVEASIATPVGGFATETTLSAINTQITNFDRNSGASGANTLRSVLATRHEAVTTPLSVKLGDGSNFLSTGPVGGLQKTFTTGTAVLSTVSMMLGWDTTTHREILLNAVGAMRIASEDVASLVNAKPEYSRSISTTIVDFSSTGITAGGYITAIFNMPAKVIRWRFTNTANAPIYVSSGGTNATIFEVVPAGGSSEVDTSLAASTSISVSSDVNVNSGKLTIVGLI